MFPTQSKVSRTSRLWLLPVVALAMLLVGYAVFAASSAQAQTPAGEYCIEGIVINWEEEPLAGWVITLTSDISGFTPITTISASAPENDDFDFEPKDKGKGKKFNFEYPEVDPDLEKGEFRFSEEDLSDASGGLGAQAGTYTATIETRPGWEGVTPTTISFPIEVGEEDCVKIRFKMRQIVLVTVIKVDADHQPLGDWIIKAIPGPGNLFASPQKATTAITNTPGTTTTAPISVGTAVFTLTPGLWIFTEQPPKTDMDDPREAFVPVVPPNGRQELLIPDDLDPGEGLTLVFKNELVTGCFIVRKFGLVPADGVPPSPLVPEFNVAGWGIKVLRADGSVARQGVTDGRGEVRFDNLPLGPYVIVEEDRPGWNETTADNFGPERDLLLTGNFCDGDVDDPVVEFRNEQDESGFCIEGRKIDANGGYGIFGWEITIEALDEGGALPVDDTGMEIDSVLTDGLGEFRFDFLRNDYRVPGAQYEICELEQDGWLAHTPTCQTVRLPEWPGKCVDLEDFVNQQVGHSESEKHDENGHDNGGKPEGDNGGNGHDNGGNGDYGGKDGEHEGDKRAYDENGHDNGNGDIQCTSYHEVQAGEGLFDIGRHYDKTPQEMLDANPSVRDGDKLWVYEGQKLCIP
jgi:hypothetical protein